MKSMAWWICLVVLAAGEVRAQRNVMEDPSADTALLTWADPSGWQVGLAYERVSRTVARRGVEWDLSADIAEAMIGVSPWPWMLIYAQAGASQWRLEGAMREDADPGAGGVLGAQLNLWQLYEGVQATSWRVTLHLAGQYAYRTTDDDGEGEVEWSEARVVLPLSYHLTFARSFRNYFMAEFQGFHVYVGPAVSQVDGTWTRQGQELDFEETENVGVVGGVDLWLLENLAFGVRVDWFQETSAQLSVRYRF